MIIGGKKGFKLAPHYKSSFCFIKTKKHGDTQKKTLKIHLRERPGIRTTALNALITYMIMNIPELNTALNIKKKKLFGKKGSKLITIRESVSQLVSEKTVFLW